MDLKERVRAQFARQARRYSATAHLRRLEKVHPMIELARPSDRDSVLDVASGEGLVALAFSPRVHSVVGVDLTPEMVTLAQGLAFERKASNVLYQLGDAEHLPFDDGSFDLVTCRAAFDHLTDPEKALREFRRVLASRGRIVLYEFVAPADPARARLYQEIETARDPSHLGSLRLDEFETLFRRCGLSPEERVVTLLRREFDPWMAAVEANEEARERVRALIQGSIEGDRAGLAPRSRSGGLTFTQTCVGWRLSPVGAS